MFVAEEMMKGKRPQPNPEEVSLQRATVPRRESDGQVGAGVCHNLPTVWLVC